MSIVCTSLSSRRKHWPRDQLDNNSFCCSNSMSRSAPRIVLLSLEILGIVGTHAATCVAASFTVLCQWRLHEARTPRERIDMREKVPHIAGAHPGYTFVGHTSHSSFVECCLRIGQRG